MALRHALIALAAATLAAACQERFDVPDQPAPTLVRATGADDPGSCAGCHPRQYSEWLGSSHNYGGGLDPTYQALEVVANYYQAHRTGKAGLRQNLFCMGCHAPTAAGYREGTITPNLTTRPAPADAPVSREIAPPAAGEDLVLPPGRASEMQEDPSLDAAALAARRRLTYQGISCDGCHKVAGPFDDLNDEDAGQACRDHTEDCAAQIRAQCEEADDPRCRRVSRGGDPEAADAVELGIANLALTIEREGTMRYGPFDPAVDQIAATPAHDVSAGATAAARAVRVSLPGETPEDVRPYFRSPQFCGACHDVRLGTDNAATAGVELDPISREPFLRLENLYSEWATSALNLHPSAPARDNPYLDADGRARRVVCQDCHMSLYPYAPPGIYPGAYTASEDACDTFGRCGSTMAAQEVDGEPTTRAGLRVIPRERVTTHNLTGVDIGLGNIPPTRELIGVEAGAPLPPSLSLPNQDQGEEVRDDTYGLPVSLDARRKKLLAEAAMVSLAGTPDQLQPDDRDCSDGTCCDEDGECNLAIKAWMTNVNGGHNVAAGFSQERQIWIELTVEDLGRRDPVTGRSPIVDCAEGSLDDLYASQTIEGDRYPRFAQPRPHTLAEANDLVDRFYGAGTSSAAPEERRCRGLSGHLFDKPHPEVGELVSDGRLGDEDLMLERVGNGVPVFADGRAGLSWQVMDFGLGSDAAAAPDDARVGRGDQFHTVGDNAFACEIGRAEWSPTLADMPVELFDEGTGVTSTAARAALGELRHRVRDTHEERLEILYPFPELADLTPRITGGRLHAGERHGLVLATNPFARICGCPGPGGESCEGPSSVPGIGEAQMPWTLTYPALPALNAALSPDTLTFPGPSAAYAPLLTALGLNGGVSGIEGATFVPLTANHLPSSRSLVFMRPQRHYYDIRVDRRTVVGPIRVAVKLWYRHFPPEFLRLLGRGTQQIHRRADALGIASELYPNGPLMVEGPDAARWPTTGNVDRLERVMMDEAVTYVSLAPAQEQSAPLALPEEPSYARDVLPVLRDTCMPCHDDVLRHGGLVFDYDAYPEWDDPKRGPATHAAQDGRSNLVDQPSRFSPGRKLVVAGDPAGSLLLEVLSRDSGGVRRMPLSTDPVSARDQAIIRRWIERGARP